jgi:glycosyltransferase involved in cell wall biosynthesis
VADDGGLSACIITFNEADRIEACVRSVDFCDDIPVVDSHSTERTRELAAALGARVIECDWPGYRSQKQFAVDSARHDWVLCLDADERVSPRLRAEILALRQTGLTSAAGWSIPRITDYFGRFLRHGNAYPDRLVRLFDRWCGGWTGYETHENTRIDGRIRRLHGDLEHYSYRSFHDHQTCMQRYADLMAQALYERGRRCGLTPVLLNPQWRFVRGYLLRLGFCIGILNHLFFWPEQYRRTGGMSIVFLFDENPDVASAGSVAQRSVGRKVFQFAPLARNQSERLRRLALASGFRLVRSFGIDRSAALARVAGRGSVGPDG